MFARLAAKLLGSEQTGADHANAETASTADLPSNPPLQFPITLFKIDGNEVQLLRPKAMVLFDNEKLIIYTDTPECADYHIAFDEICAIRQHRPTTSQFLWRGLDEMGMQFASAEDAFDFRNELLLAIVDSCVNLVEAKVSVALFNSETRGFDTWLEEAVMILSRRELDGLSALSLVKPSPDEDVMFQSELCRDIQFWPTPDIKEFTMMGPYIKGATDELVRSLFLFHIKESTDRCVEIFRILEKLVGYEEKIVQQVCNPPRVSEDSDSGGELEVENQMTDNDPCSWEPTTEGSLARDLPTDEEESEESEEEEERKPVRVRRASIVEDPSESATTCVTPTSLDLQADH
eukprot:Blabericola_migrator_1__7373@NODE_374_length_9248_cov_155_440148_g299_i0_p3_GENE_NODE_374_length_9248_cov_155_440148_g299_i0NODE_374_length_9248_cov_155_440148_g299_i0_p3_ORF_typecomplete_len348_score81_46Treacle/PF03546_14/4_2e02Treacle/PF03546_14/22_NODE_374_length_9248_cov_155_440148_g299_i023783421